MATKKQGQLTTSPEWAKHLRPLLKRWFWKGERRAEVDHLRYEIDAADPDSCHTRSVEGLLQEVEAWPDGLKKAELWVASELTLNGERVANDVAMAIIVDAILGRGFAPAGRSQGKTGATYYYEPL